MFACLCTHTESQSSLFEIEKALFRLNKLVFYSSLMMKMKTPLLPNHFSYCVHFRTNWSCIVSNNEPQAFLKKCASTVDQGGESVTVPHGNSLVSKQRTWSSQPLCYFRENESILVVHQCSSHVIVLRLRTHSLYWGISQLNILIDFQFGNGVQCVCCVYEFFWLCLQILILTSVTHLLAFVLTIK